MITCRASGTNLGTQCPPWLPSIANPRFLRSSFTGKSSQIRKGFLFSSIKRVQWKPRSDFSVNNSHCNRNPGKEGNVRQEDEGEREVHCEVEVISWRERSVKAEISIDADIESVWNALTDYEHLADFFPNLVWSGRIPCPFPGRIWLEQRGFQRAMYWHIEARVVLDLQEFINSSELFAVAFALLAVGAVILTLNVLLLLTVKVFPFILLNVSSNKANSQTLTHCQQQVSSIYIELPIVFLPRSFDRAKICKTGVTLSLRPATVLRHPSALSPLRPSSVLISVPAFVSWR